MLELEIIDAAGDRRIAHVRDDCVIGKGVQNEIRLDSWRVAREHARLIRTPAGTLIEDMGAFVGVSVNGVRIESQYGPLQDNDVIGIGPFKLRVQRRSAPTGAPVSSAPDIVTHPTAAPRAAPIASKSPPVFSQHSPATTHHGTALVPAGYPLGTALRVPDRASGEHKALEFEWRKRIHSLLLDTMDLRRHDVSSMSDQRLRHETAALIAQILGDLDAEIPGDLDRERLSRQVLNEAVGLGPLEELLDDDSVTEIMVNRYDQIYVERNGQLQHHPLTFTGDRAVLGVIERIVAPLGRRIDEASPMVDARLRDGSRVNAVIPPLALKGPTLTIRKFARHKLDAADLVRFGSLSPAMAEFLRVCVDSRKNIIVSGGTGSGKTTLLNILSNFIPAHERVITVEDAAELKLPHDHLVSLEARPPNVEGRGGVPIRDLVRNTLRMRPDRIVVGECRGAEALDMLQAMNTGHEGSLTTLHANTPRDALARLETMVLMAGMELPLTAIREQIASAVDLIVQQTRFGCGTRMVTHIVEISGMESGKIQLQELFKFVNHGYRGDHGKVTGVFTGCDMVPSFYEDLRATGHALDLGIFKPVIPAASGDPDDYSDQAWLNGTRS
jgi:pilus assembly protein CpaF